MFLYVENECFCNLQRFYSTNIWRIAWSTLNKWLFHGIDKPIEQSQNKCIEMIHSDGVLVFMSTIIFSMFNFLFSLKILQYCRFCAEIQF